MDDGGDRVVGVVENDGQNGSGSQGVQGSVFGYGDEEDVDVGDDLGDVDEEDVDVEDDQGEVQTYLGATHDFKERYYRHRTSFNNEDYRTDTTLSKYVWKLKEEGRRYSIKWRIIDRGKTYRPESGRCHLCLKEKYWLIFHKEMGSLNDNSEVWTPCMHRHSTFLSKA